MLYTIEPHSIELAGRAKNELGYDQPHIGVRPERSVTIAVRESSCSHGSSITHFLVAAGNPPPTRFAS